ncbi:sugar porter family MFS transporter [Ottowia thiooxydans]|uniref:sugar porter family MFS transporter n=1 Tax=Ottowia thiooxydans TaxID=219182 RepID=UPI00040531A2|nr:sugar porter family MFS transporter [Ottowia thiooxydans]
MIYLVAALAGLAGILFGFDEGIIAGALGPLRGAFTISPLDEGLMTAAVPLGALFGAMLAGRAAERYGRRAMLMAAGILFTLGAVGASMITAIWMLSAARLALGVAVGIAAMVAPLYISESAPPAKRGVLVAVYQLAITLGILLAYLANFGLGDAWRSMFLLGALPGIALFVGMFFMRDTPRWLQARGRTGEARAALARLHGLPPSDARIDAELAQIAQAGQTESRDVARWRELAAPAVRPALIVAMGLFLLQQLSGINAVIYYAPTVFKEAGFDSHSTGLMATIGIGIVNVLMTVVGMLLIDRIGRRRLLAVGFVGTAVSLSMISIGAMTESQSLDVVATIGLVLYIAAFAVSLGALPWVMMAEVFPRRVRSLGMSAATLANWGLNFLVVFLFPVLIATIGLGGVFAVFALACLTGIWFTLRYVPETSGVPLEVIEAHLLSGLPFHQLRPESAGRPNAAAAEASLALPREKTGALVAAIVMHNPYRSTLTPMLPRIAELAYENHQIRTALYAIWQDSAFARTGTLRASDLSAHKGTIWRFLEHIHYASPEFLASVREGGATPGNPNAH